VNGPGAKRGSRAASGILGCTVMLLFGAASACRCLAELGGDEVRERFSFEKPHDLGTAVYPQTGPRGAPASHQWLARALRPSNYRLGYALEASEAAAVDRDLAAYARKVEYEPMGDGKFRWFAPKGCGGDLQCIYEEIASRNRADMVPIAERFRARAKEARLSSLETAQLVVTFVQAIPYEVPDKEPFGVLPPALVVSRKKGDCDSKALVAHMILHELGIDSVMLASNAHRHEMLGIALPAPGTTITYGGRRYAFTEMTAKGSPIGHVNSELLAPNDWKVLAVKVEGRAEKTRR